MQNENENKNDPEPRFVIRGKDTLAIRTIQQYQILCEERGLNEQAEEASKAAEEILEWQFRNKEQVKYPDHKHVPVDRTATPMAPKGTSAYYAQTAEGTLNAILDEMDRDITDEDDAVDLASPEDVTACASLAIAAALVSLLVEYREDRESMKVTDEDESPFDD